MKRTLWDVKELAVGTPVQNKRTEDLGAIIRANPAELVIEWDFGGFSTVTPTSPHAADIVVLDKSTLSNALKALKALKEAVEAIPSLDDRLTDPDSDLGKAHEMACKVLG